MFKRLIVNSDKNIFYPINLEEYENFFKKNYIDDWVDCECLCEIKKKDILVSSFDRHKVKFQTVICSNCGLMRAKKYLNEEALKDFYTNHYRRLTKTIEPEKKFFQQFKTSKRKGRYSLIDKFLNTDKKIIFDIGGASGGFLYHYIKNNKTFLFDYDDKYTSFAKTMNVNVISGGFDEALKQEKKPDLIILNHVIEHWNNFESEIKKLFELAHDKTIIYIETPGIDSLKKGRRHSDILGDIQIAHKYYFSSYVLENILNKYQFKCLYIDSEIRVICIKNEKQKYNFKNNFFRIIIDIYLAEIRRYLSIKKSIIFKKHETN